MNSRRLWELAPKAQVLEGLGIFLQGHFDIQSLGNGVSSGEGKRQNEFAEWHVAWLAECKIWKMAQRNKLN